MKCAHTECDNNFEPKTHNQKYCSDECCKIATSIKIKQKYRDNKDRLSGKARTCKTNGCKHKLSKYNTGNFCNECERKDEINDRAEILKALGL